MNHKLGIALGMSVAQVEKAILENPSAKAVLVNNPTYYGVCSNLRAITELAHRHNMLVLADEPTAPIFILGKICPLPPCGRERIWPPSPCTNPAAA